MVCEVEEAEAALRVCDPNHATNFNHERYLNSFKWAVSQIEVLAIWNAIFLWILRYTGKEKATNLTVFCINFHYKMPAISF